MRIRHLVVAAAAVAFALTACQPEIRKDVMFVSDSVTAQSAEEITQEFGAVSTNDGGRYIASFGSSLRRRGSPTSPA